jgi:hypothetical protein
MFNLLSEHTLNILNFALVGLIAMFVGLSIKDVYELRAASEVVPVAPRRVGESGVRQLSGPRPRSSYDAITQRDIFNLPTASKLPVTKEDLHIKLIGTSHLTTTKPFAIIEDQAGNQSLFQIGDTVPGVGPLLQVAQDKIIVLYNGHRVTSEIPRAETNLPDRSESNPGNLVVEGGRRILMPGFR